MIYTTYRTLYGTILEEDIPWLEGHVTGNSLIYGLDTPIDLYVVNNLGYTYMAAEMLRFANSATIMSILAQELINAYPYPWKDLYGYQGENAINDMLFRANQVIDTEVRLNYCGDPIPGVAALDTESLAVLSANVESYFMSWVSNPVDRYTYSWQSIGSSPIPKTYALSGGWSWDNVVIRNPGYTVDADVISIIPYNIDAALAANPNIFWEQSELIKEQMQAHLVQYIQRMKRKDDHFDTYLDQRAKAAEYMAQAAILAAEIAIGDSYSLEQIIFYVDAAVKLYESYLYQDITHMTLRYTEIGNMYYASVAAPEGTLEYDNEKRLLDIIYAKRYDLLHDATFIHSFDVDISGALSDEEHAAMEEGITAELLTYAGDVVTADFSSAPSTDIMPTLQSVMSAYLL
jgi:hypothetical protein